MHLAELLSLAANGRSNIERLLFGSCRGWRGPIARAGGRPCWIGFRDVDPGDDYRRSITKAMDEVAFLVLVYSTHVNTSFDIATELLLARKRGRKRFVLKMDTTEPYGPVEYESATVQLIDCIANRAAGIAHMGRRAAGL